MRENLFAGAIPTLGKNTHAAVAAMHIQISKIFNFYCSQIHFCAFIFALIENMFKYSYASTHALLK